jgi:D-proline reductase (dithiol) PrdB
MTNSPTVDSFRFIETVTRAICEAWIQREEKHVAPWTPLTKPLDQCRLAMISTAGISQKGDVPFDMEGERQNPWWGDPSHRELRRESTSADIDVNHLHIDTQYIEKDLDCALPLKRLLELETAGEIQSSAPTHYSIMGYILRPKQLIEETVPKIIAKLKEEEVDVVLLVPV